MDSDSTRISQGGGEAPRGTSPPPPVLRTLRKTLANRGNNTKPRRVALRCQALTHPLSLSPVIRNRSLCLPHLSPTLVVRYCTPAEASPLPPSLSPSPFHLMAQGSPELDWLLLFVSPIFVAHHHGPHGLVLRLSCPCLCHCSKFCTAAAASVDCFAASAATMLLLSPLPCLAVLQLCVCRRNAASLLNSHTTQHSTFLSAKKSSITSARGLHEKNLRRNA